MEPWNQWNLEPKHPYFVFGSNLEKPLSAQSYKLIQLGTKKNIGTKKNL